MSGKVQEIRNLVDRHALAAEISNKYESWQQQRAEWVAQKRELRNYIFATDTKTTSNSKLPWKNSTHLPKLCQIRDNLHANYMAAWFSSDEWMDWEAGDAESDNLKKRQAIKSYMKNKLQESNFRNTIADLAYDFIDYGNCFAEVVWVNESKIDAETGEKIPGYVGPKLLRQNPVGQIFNPTAPSYLESPKISRYVKTIGELKAEMEDRPDLHYNAEIIAKMENVRRGLGAMSTVDIDEAMGFSVDGFGTLQEYYQSDWVEILEFEGDIHDTETGVLLRDQVITIVDRNWVVRKEANPSWYKYASKIHTGWRKRPDNLYYMGPLDNLVGMQYRIDHLENIKADAADLIIHPPVKIKGMVEDFIWGPMEKILVGEDGDVETMTIDAQVLMVNQEIAILEDKMERMAGAPEAAMGIRTPGEKTAFEVQTTEKRLNRIFEAKTTHFEIEMIERALNMMLEVAVRNFSGEDLVRVMDDDIGVADFINITKEDITAKGKLRARGARHFSAQAQLIQNINGLATSPLWSKIERHMSSKQLAKMVEMALGFEKFVVVRDNIAVMEDAESTKLANQANQKVQEDNLVNTSAGDIDV